MTGKWQSHTNPEVPQIENLDNYNAALAAAKQQLGELNQKISDAMQELSKLQNSIDATTLENKKIYDEVTEELRVKEEKLHSDIAKTEADQKLLTTGQLYHVEAQKDLAAFIEEKNQSFIEQTAALRTKEIEVENKKAANIAYEQVLLERENNIVLDEAEVENRIHDLAQKEDTALALYNKANAQIELNKVHVFEITERENKIATALKESKELADRMMAMKADIDNKAAILRQGTDTLIARDKAVTDKIIIEMQLKKENEQKIIYIKEETQRLQTLAAHLEDLKKTIANT